MNTFPSLVSHFRKLIETKISTYFRPQPCRRRRFEVQLEFPWHLKR